MKSIHQMILYLLIIISISFNEINGTTDCYQCQGFHCRYRSNWNTCKGDACFKGNTEKHFKSYYENSKKTIDTDKKNVNKFNSDKHHAKPTIKSTTKFHYPLKTTTDYFKFFQKTSSHILSFKSTTNPLTKSTTKPTTISTTKSTVKTTFKMTTKSYKSDTKKPTAKGFTYNKGHIKKRNKRSSDYDRGCIMEKDIPKLGCHNHFCVCLKNYCNAQPKIINDAVLLISSCFITMAMSWFQ